MKQDSTTSYDIIGLTVSLRRRTHYRRIIQQAAQGEHMSHSGENMSTTLSRKRYCRLKPLHTLWEQLPVNMYLQRLRNPRLVVGYSHLRRLFRTEIGVLTTTLPVNRQASIHL
jgi:hypothetical protein